MNNTYLSEDREGGMMALGSDIPNPPRADLNVLYDKEFEKQKQKLIYQAWVKHALATN